MTKAPDAMSPEVDMETLLKNDEFVKFLAEKFGDDSDKAAEKNDEALMAERFELFKQRKEAEKEKEPVKKNLRDFFRKDIQKDIGLELSDNDLKAVDAHIEKMVSAVDFDSLAEFKSLKNDLERLSSNEAMLATEKAKIEEYKKGRSVTVSELNAAEDKVDVVGQAEESERLLGRLGKLDRAFHFVLRPVLGAHESDDIRKSVSSSKEKGGLGLKLDFETLDSELKKLQGEIKTKQQKIEIGDDLLERAEEAEKSIVEIKRRVLEAHDLSEELAKVAKQVAEKKFKELLTDPAHAAKEAASKTLVEETEKEVKKLQDDIDDLTSEIIGLEAKKANIDKQLDKIELDNSETSQLTPAENDFYDERTKLTEQLKTKRSEYENKKSQLKTAEDKIALASEDIPKGPIPEKKLTEGQKIMDNLVAGRNRESAYAGAVYQQDIDEMSDQIQLATQETLKNVIESTKIGKGGFDAMNKALQGLITKGSIGAMPAAEVKDFIHGTLNWILGDLPKDNDGNAKRIIVRGLMYKYGLSKAA